MKGKQAPAVKPAAPVPTGPPPVLENSHQFQEYTYKNITSCDVCSQIMRGGWVPHLKTAIIETFPLRTRSPGLEMQTVQNECPSRMSGEGEPWD